MSDHCPACPEARIRLRRLARGRPGLRVVEHDVDLPEGREHAEAYGLIAVPAFVVDGASISYGIPTDAWILGQFLRRHVR
ncbi:MAG: thioredoxin [Vicinamibacterales bacterium]